MASISQESDIHVTFEDQQKINKFARQNALLDELIDQLKAKEKDLQGLEDAESDLLLASDHPTVSCKLGEVFVSLKVDEAEEMIGQQKKDLEQEIVVLRGKHDAVKSVMSDLKVQLYAKFGNNINLEADDS